VATPDWHLFNALAATRAALPGLNSLAASARPQHDAAAETKTLEALAAATVRPNAPNANANAPPAQPTPMGTPLGGFAALSPLQNQGTPSFTPRPRLGSLSLMGGLSRPGSTFAPSVAADSPKF
jgi:mediator of RNA polymerase II transcription subunit 6